MTSSLSLVKYEKKKGTKRKIEIKKRDSKQQRAVTCTKRRQTVFSKAADLCLLSGANVAVFITSPSDISDVVYSFSGYSPAYEIADCYLNHKPPPKIINPQPKLRFWWEDPNLYHSCDDLSELNIIEDRMQRVKKHMMACLEKKEKTQFVSNADQNSSTCSLDEDCDGSSSQIASNFGPNPSSSVDTCCNDQTIASLYRWSSPQMVSLDQNPNSSSQSSSHIASLNPNPSSGIQGGSSSSD